MAFLQSFVISILRIVGLANIARALRFYAAHPRQALTLIAQPTGE
jgi:hypothetical protein